MKAGVETLELIDNIVKISLTPLNLGFPPNLGGLGSPFPGPRPPGFGFLPPGGGQPGVSLQGPGPIRRRITDKTPMSLPSGRWHQYTIILVPVEFTVSPQIELIALAFVFLNGHEMIQNWSAIVTKMCDFNFILKSILLWLSDTSHDWKFCVV